MVGLHLDRAAVDLAQSPPPLLPPSRLLLLLPLVSCFSELLAVLFALRSLEKKSPKKQIGMELEAKISYENFAQFSFLKKPTLAQVLIGPMRAYVG